MTLIVERKQSVRRLTKRYPDPNNPGFVVNTDEVVQELVQTTFINGVRMWDRVIDHETVPAFVADYMACYGDTGGWQSKFSELI